MHVDVTAFLLRAPLPAHEGLGEHESLWAAWHIDPQLLLPVALGAALYARGLLRWRDRSRRHAPWRVAAYYLGLLTLVLALESPLDTLSEHHFSMHMIQHELTMMVAIPLLLLGAPTTPLLRGMPRTVLRDFVGPVMRSAVAHAGYRFVTRPVVVIVIFTVQLWMWHLAPGWYAAALEHRAVHDLQHFSFAASAGLLWWTVIDPVPLRARIGHLPRLLFLLAVSTPKHVLAAFITLSDDVLFPVYEDVPTIFDHGLLADQQLGGVIMWAPSQMMFVIAMAVVFFVWAAASERDQQAADAVLVAHPEEARPA